MKKATTVLFLLVGMVLAHTWSAPVAIVATDAEDLTGGPGTNNQVVDSQGTLHFVFFSDFETPGNREIYYMNNEGGVWSEPLRLSRGESMSHGPSMAIDAAGNITVVWYDYRLEYPYSDLYWCRYDAATGTWSEDLPLVVVSGSGQAAPLVLAEPDGKVHLVWCDGRHGDSRVYELYYRSWENGQWTDEVQLTDVGSYTRWLPAMIVGEAGNLYLFWADDRTAKNDWHMYYMKMSPDGDWGGEINLGPGAPQDLTIFSDYLFVSQIHSVETSWNIPGAPTGIYDPNDDGPTQVRYSVKNLYDPDDVWVLRDISVSPARNDYVKQATISVCRSGVRLVWGQGITNHFNLYQATVGLGGQSAPQLFGPIIGDTRLVSLSHGPRGDLNLIFSYTTTGALGWDIYYQHDAIPREGDIEGYSPPRISLGSITPNPASNGAVVSFDVPATGNVEVAVYDTAGRRVGTVFSGTLTAGRHELAVDTSGLLSGTYYVRASSDGAGVSAPLVITR